ncbi:MAG: hypothetical protein AAGD18_17430 [Actinomycetota bacterium]
MKRTVVLLLLGAAVAVGCSSGDSGSERVASSDVEGEWRLVQGQSDGQPLVVPDGRRGLLSIAARRAHAHSPCVPYFGVISPTENGLRLEVDRDAVFAGVGCGPVEEKFGQDQQDALVRVDRLALDAQDRLVASGDGVELIYEPLGQVPDAIFDRDWSLISWRPSNSMELVPAAAEASLRFNSDGTFEGASGCDRWFAGTWEPDRDGLRFPRFDIEGPCPGEPLDRIVDQHGTLTALGIGARPLIVDDQLHLITSVGINDIVSFVFE